MRARVPRYALGSWHARLIADLRPSSRDARPVRKRGGATLPYGLAQVGDRWWALVETACLRRDAAVVAGPADGVAMLGLKAEFGTPQLRVWAVDLKTGAEPAVTLAAGHAEVFSPPGRPAGRPNPV